MEKKLRRAQRRGGEDHSAAGEPPRLAANPRGGLDGAYFVSGAAVAGALQRFDVDHSCFGKDPGSALFSQVQITKVQRIFRAIPATHHAATAANAGGSRRTFATEIWIREGLAARLSLRRLEDAHLRSIESMPRARGFGGFLQEKVSGSEDSVFRYTQHPRCGFVVLGHFRFPIGQSCPRAGSPYFLGRLKQGTGVGDGSTTDRAAVENSCVSEELNVEEAAQAEVGPPNPAMDGPTGVWQIVRRPAPAHLHDRDPIPLFRQPKGRNTATEARTDNDEVKIEVAFAGPHRFLVARFQISCDIPCDRSIHNVTVSIFFCLRTFASITCPILRSASALCGESSPNI